MAVIATVDKILKNPAAHLVIGPKPHKNRKSIKFLKGVTYAAALYTATLFSLNFYSVHQENDQRIVFDTKVEKIQWDEMVNNPWTMSGFSQDGKTFSSEKMLESWRGAGVKIEDIGNMYKLVSVFSPTLYGRESEILYSKKEEKRRIVEETLQDALPQVYENLVTGRVVLMNKREAQEWKEEAERVLRQESGMLMPETRGILTRDVSDNVSMEQAKQSLEKAISETGLASLTLPMEYWSNPKMIQGSAQRLVAANKDLQELTGIQGKVLGLNGDVSLQIMNPLVEQASGLFQVADKMGYIDTTWQSLGHEWFHAFDNKVIRTQTPHGLSTASQFKESQGWLWQIKQKAALLKEDPWVALVDRTGKELGSAAPQWNTMLAKFVSSGPYKETGFDTHGENYQEKIAYSFANYTHIKNAQSLFEMDTLNAQKLYLSKEEASKQEAIFDGFFAQMKDSPIAKALTVESRSKLLASKTPEQSMEFMMEKRAKKNNLSR